MRINPTPPTDWKDLQCQVARILRECGLTAEVEVSIDLVRGSKNADVRAEDITQMPAQVGLCECKYWATAVPQNEVHAFRTVVQDYGANWGYMISRVAFQSGAHEAVERTNVRLFTWQEFEAQWQER